MENKTIISIFIIALIASVLFFGMTITGMVVHKVDYNDLCREDLDCPGEQCCLIYEDKDIGICMEQCQSFEFLCKADSECEEGTVCCISEGMEYGICNQQEKCLSVDIFADYVGKVSFLEPELLEKKSPEVEMPGRIDSNKVIVIETLIIITLIAFIIWFLLKRRK